MGQTKNFTDIWFDASIGKLEASAAWKKWLEILMGGGAWEKCLRGCMRGCSVAQAGTGAWELPRVDAKSAWKFRFVCFNTKSVVMSH